MSLTDIGILFRGDMVRALLAGEKRVTRRAMKPQPVYNGYRFDGGSGHIACHSDYLPPSCLVVPPYYDVFDPHPEDCRYSVGRRLWVRETWAPHNPAHPMTRVDFRADMMSWGRTSAGEWMFPETLDGSKLACPAKWTPSLLMPRWASRLTLLVTDVRAERLTKITPEDVALEGFVHAGLGSTPKDYCREYRKMYDLSDGADPWLWRIAFDVVQT